MGEQVLHSPSSAEQETSAERQAPDREDQARGSKNPFAPLELQRREGQPSTPLQRLLDPTSALLERSSPLLASGQVGRALPAWNGFQSAAIDLSDTESRATRGGACAPPTLVPAGSPTLTDLTLAGPAEAPDTTQTASQHTGSGSERLPERPVMSPLPEDFKPFQATLDETVVEALIQALYEALPGDLEVPSHPHVSETTPSGNVVGRLQGTVGGTPGREHSQPRQLVRGAVDSETVRVTLQSLPALTVDAPFPDPAQTISKAVVLGHGEACFLRAQSALWAWRTHRQNHLQLHSAGPPALHRDALIEQRIGPLTFLIGCRVTRQEETPRSWSLAMASLSGQVIRSRESLRLEWQADDQVVFSCTSQQAIALNTLSFLTVVHNAVRRMTVRGYVRTMQEMSAASNESYGID